MGCAYPLGINADLLRGRCIVERPTAVDVAGYPASTWNTVGDSHPGGPGGFVFARCVSCAIPVRFLNWCAFPVRFLCVSSIDVWFLTRVVGAGVR